MNKSMSKRQKDIKSKLMAAISMLLVASIMMVSSTYAWFTLSTAPEVTGIQTAVGANGNLEMALLYPDLQDSNGALLADWGNQIKSGETDSMEAAGRLISEANKTWGNLVDVSDYLTYGLNNITLYPSQMVYQGAGHEELAANPLARPVYGADGRVADVKADTLTASFASGTFSNENAFGVRAVGTASSMTARELAHRAALTNAANASTDAKGYASNSLKANGNVLAGMAVAYIGNPDTDFTYDQVNTLKTVVTALQSAHLEIEESMKWYVIAHNIAPDTVTDTTYLTIQQTIDGMTLAAIATSTEYSRPNGFADAYTALTASQAKVTSALTTLDSALQGKSSSDTFKWGTFSAALTAIMDTSLMTMNDIALNELEDSIGELMQNMGGGLKLQMRPGSGVFADIADFCGTYSAEITLPEETVVKGIDIGGMPATMTTDKPRNPTWLTDIRNTTAEFASAAGGETTKSITDFYGYIIDLAFRTNASGSNLLLQADAIDRIYGAEGKNEDTMGGGSTMTFTTTDATSFGVNKVSALMSSIRIVFFEPDTSKILGYAQLNPATSEIVGNSVTMELAMWDFDTKDFKTDEGANVITALNQNEAKAVSVLVYLDGASVTNKDVAATGSQSMVGTMNLQFASSAELQPMDYADLKDGKSSTEDSGVFDLTAVTASEGYTVTKAIGGSLNVSGVSAKGFGVVLSKALAEGEVITATVGGQQITGTPAVVDGMNGYAFLYDGTLAADTEITITISAPSDDPDDGEDDEPASGITNLTNVTVAKEEEYKITSASFIGNDVTIKLSANEYAKMITAVESVKVDGEEFDDYLFDEDTLTFTYDGIAADTPIEVTANVDDRTFMVLIMGGGAEGAEEATYGQDYTFTLLEGYTLSTLKIGNDDAIENVTPDGNKYTIPGEFVDSSIYIEVTGPSAG